VRDARPPGPGAVHYSVETPTSRARGDPQPRPAVVGFLSVLTAAIASRFVKTERGPEYEEMLSSLGRIEAELADLRQQLEA
jgi:hypothetical protein